ncbi:MAG TPA: AAA family ATPase [Blastocatellia bacterium]|jgi:SpoVK/Ycf46/Vps4 family AAA+-type ATPase|nr:AAA family ATPase [Blastocatellia bacterium]
MSSRTKLLLDEIDQLPAWAARMARKYYAGEASHFLLYNNIYDLVRAGSEYISLPNYLQRELVGTKHLITYNRSEGIRFGSHDAERAFQAQLRVSDPLMGRDAMKQLPKDPGRAIPLIEHFLLYGDQVAVIINFIDTIIPAGDVSYMSGDDRTNLVALQRWITSSRLLKKDNIVILVAESVAEVHPRIRQNSRLAATEIPYPDDAERLEFITWMRAQLPQLQSEVTDQQLSMATSGLNRVHLNSLLRSAATEPDGLTPDKIRRKKKELIEAECVGLVEFVHPRFGLDAVGGMSKAKAFMKSIADTIRNGIVEEAPMGILISGPVGTGKTFLAESFAHDCGLNVVAFKNFRERWVGSSEANLEKILNLLQSLAPIVVLVDEADATLGSRESGGDSGVDARIFSKLAAAMGDTRNRGRILWILMTSRPDLLPIDLKRQGRAEEHISLFYPETEEDRLAIVEAMVRKNKIKHEVTDWSHITGNSLSLSGADIESMLIRARRMARMAGRGLVGQEDIATVAREFSPARDEMAVEYQTLVAAREATSREMVPERYRHLSPVELSQRIEELRSFIR